MTSLSEAREQVYQTWVDNVPSGLDSWTFENEEGFDEPDQDKCWARVLMRSIGGGQETLGASGGRKFRRTASVLVEIFTPEAEAWARVMTWPTRSETSTRPAVSAALTLQTGPL